MLSYSGSQRDISLHIAQPICLIENGEPPWRAEVAKCFPITYVLWSTPQDQHTLGQFTIHHSASSGCSWMTSKILRDLGSYLHLRGGDISKWHSLFSRNRTIFPLSLRLSGLLRSKVLLQSGYLFLMQGIRDCYLTSSVMLITLALILEDFELLDSVIQIGYFIK